MSTPPTPFLQRATAAERVDLRGSELLPQDVETMWTTAARSDGRRRAMAGQAHRLLLVRPGRPRSCPLLWAAAAWLPLGCRWFVVFPLGGQKKWLLSIHPRCSETETAENWKQTRAYLLLQ